MDNNFSQRLLALRLNTGMTQDAMAALCGVQKRAQIYYEHGQRLPDIAYVQSLTNSLKKLGTHIDVSELVTGEKAAVIASPLTKDEEALIAAYRTATATGKKFIEQAAGMAAVAVEPPKPKKKPPVKQTVEKSNGVVQINGSSKNTKVKVGK